MLRNQRCEECPLNKRCIYAQVFSTPVIDNELFKGNKKPHPFVIYADMPVGKETSICNLNLLLIGETVTLFPYLYFALKEAGKHGVFKERVPFEIKRVWVNGKKIKVDKKNIDMNFDSLLWELNGDLEYEYYSNTVIQFQTPIKIERHKRIVRNLDYREFILNGLRRLKLLSHFYGEGANTYVDLASILNTEISEKNEFEPVSIRYYSFRQQKAVYMKGVIGKMEIKKKVNRMEQSLLRGIEIFNIGKATSFGFGKVKIDFL